MVSAGRTKRGRPGHAHDSKWIAQLCLRTISRTGGFGEETLDAKEMGERRTVRECGGRSGRCTPSRCDSGRDGGRTVQGAADRGWQGGLERSLAGGQHGKLGPPGTRGAPRTGGGAGRGRRRTRGPRCRGGRSDPVSPGRGSKKEGEF